METKVSKCSYGNYSSDNYGAHSIRLTVGSLRLWFSYDTVVAFQDGYGECQVCVNSWGTTSGKHLNIIDGGNKKERLERAVFEHNLEAVLAKHGLVV